MKTLKEIFEKYQIYNDKGELFPLLETELGKELFEEIEQSSQSDVGDSLLPVDNRIRFAEYIQLCVIKRGQMTYPSLQEAIKAWDEISVKFDKNPQ